jgi:hypothetical protein
MRKSDLLYRYRDNRVSKIQRYQPLKQGTEPFM